MEPNQGDPLNTAPSPSPPPHLPPNLLLQAAEFATPGWKQHISKNVLPHPNLSRTLQFPPHLPYFHLFLSHPSESSFLKSSDFSWFADTLPSSRFSFILQKNISLSQPTSIPGCLPRLVQRGLLKGVSRQSGWVIFPKNNVSFGRWLDNSSFFFFFKARTMLSLLIYEDICIQESLVPSIHQKCTHFRSSICWSLNKIQNWASIKCLGQPWNLANMPYYFICTQYMFWITK